MNETEKFQDIVQHVRYFAPKFNTVLKTESKFHRIIGWFFNKLGNPNYATSYWTTIGQTVGRPNVCNTGEFVDEWQVIAHEGRHAADAQKLGVILFTLIYLFPLWIGVLGCLYGLALIPVLFLGAPASLLWGLLLLLGLLPVPALGRTILEIRGYMVSLAVRFWSGKITDKETTINWTVSQFTGFNYYFMFPFKGLLTRYFNKKYEQLQTGTLKLDPYLALCKTKSFQYKS